MGAAEPAGLAGLVRQYCLECHDDGIRKGGVSFESLATFEPAANPDLWEKVARKLEHRQMPPLGEPRPGESVYRNSVTQLHAALDRAAQAKPDPGRTETFRRLNRTEYQNAIRDLLDLQIDAAALLPADDASHGFDNVTVGNLSPTLLDRYVSAAEKISRLALGTPRRTPGGDTVRLRPDLTQESHLAGLPPGTRGGAVVPYTFPRDGEYEIQIRLARDRNELVEGLRRPHDVEILLNRAPVATFTVKPPEKGQGHDGVDAHLKARITVQAGPQQLAVTFPQNSASLLETERQPFLAHYNMHRHPRITPAVYQISIVGPLAGGAAGDTPSRRRIFAPVPDAAALANAAAEQRAAEKILGALMRRAYRRPVTAADLERPLAFYRTGRAEGGFEAGIEHALTAVLVSPRFLFRIEEDPAGAAPGSVYRLDPFTVASRLSFFLWSSIPDDALLEAAETGALLRPEVRAAQVRRMLADPKARSLVTNFASQWLHLRNLDSLTPDRRLFPDFDDNRRQAMRQETELFVESVIRENRTVGELLTANYTFLNERLAKHYGIPHIYGSRFRRVDLGPERQRGGLLRHGSILAVTSYATRTSPVIRGHWILANLVGSPPPPPPPNVPSLDNAKVSETLPIRERLAAHRENPSCASCHNVMDPVGFALENFDAVGRWRATEDGRPVDVSGGLPDGTKVAGVAALERGLAGRPELLAGTLAEKLLTFALGRGVAPADGPAIRGIVRRAAADDYRFAGLILGIVESPTFLTRKAP